MKLCNCNFKEQGNESEEKLHGALLEIASLKEQVILITWTLCGEILSTPCRKSLRLRRKILDGRVRRPCGTGIKNAEIEHFL